MWSVITKCAYLIPHLHICPNWLITKNQICNNWYAYVKSYLRSLPTYAPKGGPRCIFCEYSEPVSRELQNSSLFLYKGIGDSWFFLFFWACSSFSVGLQVYACTQQNTYSISHLHGTVTTQWLDSDSVVTFDNWQVSGLGRISKNTDKSSIRGLLLAQIWVMTKKLKIAAVIIPAANQMFFHCFLNGLIIYFVFVSDCIRWDRTCSIKKRKRWIAIHVG